MGRRKEIINYIIIGGLTTAVSLLVYYICVFTVLDPESAIQLQTANVISWIVSVSFAYITNRIFVFHSKNTKLLREMLFFFLSRITTLLFDMLLMFVMVTCMHFDDKISKLVVQILVIVGNYVLSRIFVFKEKGTRISD